MRDATDRRGPRQRRRRDLDRTTRAILERRGSIGAADLAVVIERILAPLGRRLDRTTPIVDARLGDGTRVCAVVPPISVDGDVPVAAAVPRRAAARSTAFGGRRRRSVPRRARRAPLQRGDLRRDIVGQDVAAVQPARARPARRAPRRCSRTPPSLLPRPTTSSASKPARRATTACPRSRVEQLLHTALRLRPDRLVVGEVRGARGARSRPGAEHRPRRLVVDVPRQQRPRCAAPARDARRPGRPGVAAARRPRPPRALHRRRRPRRATCRAVRGASAEIAEVIDGDGVPGVRPIVRAGTGSASCPAISGDAA